MQPRGNLSRMVLIHLLLSHQNVGFKEAFDVQLAFFMVGGERESSESELGLGEAGDDPAPQIQEEWSSEKGSA